MGHEHGPHQGRALGIRRESGGEIHGFAIWAARILVVLVGAPGECTDSAGQDDGCLENEELVDVGARDACRSGIDNGAFDLEVGDADCGQLGQVLVDRGNISLGGLQAVMKAAGEPSQIGCALVKTWFIPWCRSRGRYIGGRSRNMPGFLQIFSRLVRLSTDLGNRQN